MTTKLTIRTFAVLVALLGSDQGLCEDNAKLPVESKQLVERLEVWESAQREELDNQIREKIVKVVAVLKNQLEEATIKGNLDSALAIREKISDLESRAKEKISELESRVIPASPRELDAWLEGRKIEFIGNSGRHLIEFKRDGAFLYHQEKTALEITYRVLSDRTVELNWDTTYKLEYSDDMTKATLISPAGKYLVTTSNKG